MKISFGNSENVSAKVANAALRHSICRSATNPTLNRAFTMIEIAISLAVIGFALVAIVGILPRGLNVQKDNRTDTVINQDGPYLMEAIRSGADQLNYLTNHVESIAVSYGGALPVIYTNSPGAVAPFNGSMTNGYIILGLLSTPKFFYATNGTRSTNSVVAHVRALTGTAVEQGGTTREFAFRYQVSSEIVPFTFFQENSTNWTAYTNGYPEHEWVTRSNRWVEANKMTNNLSEVRLTFRWPLYPNGNLGDGRQVYRLLIAGAQTNKSGFFFFQPESYAQQ